MTKRLQFLPLFVAILSVLTLMTSCIVIDLNEVPYTEGTVMMKDSYGNCILDIDQRDFRKAGFSVYDTIDITVTGRTYHGMIIDNYALLPVGVAFIFFDKNGVDITASIEFMDTGWAIGDRMSVKKTGYNDLRTFLPNLCLPKKTQEQCETDAEYGNFREITAGDIASGRLYRSSTPIYDGKDNRILVVNELCQQSDISYIIGMDKNEKKVQELYAAGKLDGTYYKTVYENGDVYNESITCMIFTNPEFKMVMESIIENDGSYLISCLIGQDRTGFIVMLIETLMGATYEEMCDDFMLSYYNFYGITEGMDEYDLEVQARFDRMFIGVHYIDIIDSPEKIDWYEDVGSYDLYSDAVHFVKKQYGMTDSDIQLLKDRLSTPL